MFTNSFSIYCRYGKLKSRLFIRDCDVALEKKTEKTDYNIVKT